MARYIITGATGFLGQAMTRVLEESGHQTVKAARRRPPGSQGDWLEYDLDDSSTIDNIVGADAAGIFHLAWSTIPSTAQRNPAADIRTNLAGTVALFQAMTSAPGVPLVFVSSGGTVYGHPSRLPIPEEHPLRPISAYGAAKAAAERYASIVRSNCRVDIRVARPGNPYGEGQYPSRGQGAVSVFAARILAGEPISIWGDNETVRDYIYVDDAARGLEAIMNCDLTDQPNLPVYNIGSGRGVSLTALATMIGHASGAPVKMEFLPARGFDIARNVLDISKIKRDMNWRPQYSLSQGLLRMIHSFRADPGQHHSTGGRNAAPSQE